MVAFVAFAGRNRRIFLSEPSPMSSFQFDIIIIGFRQIQILFDSSLARYTLILDRAEFRGTERADVFTFFFFFFCVIQFRRVMLYANPDIFSLQV